MSKITKLVLAVVLLGLLLGIGAPIGAGPGPAGLSSEPISWYERGRQRQAFLAQDEIVLFSRRGSVGGVREFREAPNFPGATVLRQNGYLRLLRLAAPLERAKLQERSAARSLSEPTDTGLVFYADRTRSPSGRLVLRNEIVVRFPGELSETARREFETSHGLTRVRELSSAPHAFLYRAADPLTALETANRIESSGQVTYACPNWQRTYFPRRTIPDDPLFPDEWHLYNTGQSNGTAGEDINATLAWDLYQGTHNEVIAVVDSGIENDHEDLVDNVLTALGRDWVDDDNDPTWTDDDPANGGDHGVHVAGVAAGRGFNAIGVCGVAPLAALVGHRLLGADTDVNTAEALTRNKDVIDIYNNSWGPPDYGDYLLGPGPLAEDAIENGARNGRDGLGCIYIWSGGNGYDTDNANYDGYANSRYTIAVAASTDYGDRAPYSEKGANILVNAPSSGGWQKITTTAGNNDYTDAYTGTSASAPIVAGVVALMLQANPNLTWRDVMAILVETATQNDPPILNDSKGWTVNGAGYHINHKYGFGRVDAEAAVSLAAAWTFPLETEVQAAKNSKPSLSIPDNDAIGVSDTITLASDLTVEFVTVTFSAPAHQRWGDLEIVLVSPAGTESVLAEMHDSVVSPLAFGQYDGWRFGTVRCFGESSQGAWTLQVRDRRATYTGTFTSWVLRVYGTGTVDPSDKVSSSGGGGGGGGGCFIQALW